MKANLPLAILMLSTLALAACSSDEDNSPSDPGGGDPADTIAPTVTAVQPPEDSTLQPGVVITIEFSEAMDFQTLHSGTITVIGSSSGLHDGSYAYAGTTLAIDPAADFTPGETVTSTVLSDLALPVDDLFVG